MLSPLSSHCYIEIAADTFFLFDERAVSTLGLGIRFFMFCLVPRGLRIVALPLLFSSVLLYLRVFCRFKRCLVLVAFFRFTFLRRRRHGWKHCVGLAVTFYVLSSVFRDSRGTIMGTVGNSRVQHRRRYLSVGRMKQELQEWKPLNLIIFVTHHARLATRWLMGFLTF